MKVSKPPFSAASASQSTVAGSRETTVSPSRMVMAPASSTTISPVSISSVSRVSGRNAGMADAMNSSPSPTPTTMGHSRRAATRRPGSSADAATNAK